LWNHLLRRLVILGLVVILHFSLATPPSFAQGITPQSIITTLVGTDQTFQGDGGPAIDAHLGFVTGIAVDSAGNLFAADFGNHLVVKVSPTGLLTVVAGNGIRGFSGDEGPATSASLNNPRGVAVDAAGNLYIADLSTTASARLAPMGLSLQWSGPGKRASLAMKVLPPALR